jgi:drug/metabolite transporter (DMT)-like permease
MVFSNEQIDFTNLRFYGLTMVLLSSLLYSFTVLIFKHQSGNYTIKETVFFQNFIGAIIFLPFALILTSMPSLQQFTGASFYSILIGVVGFVLFFKALKKIPASNASILSYSEVISGAILGLLVFNENFTIQHLIGLVFIGIACIQTAKNK